MNPRRCILNCVVEWIMVIKRRRIISINSKLFVTVTIAGDLNNFCCAATAHHAVLVGAWCGETKRMSNPLLCDLFSFVCSQIRQFRVVLMSSSWKWIFIIRFIYFQSSPRALRRRIVITGDDHWHQFEPRERLRMEIEQFMTFSHKSHRSWQA